MEVIPLIWDKVHRTLLIDVALTIPPQPEKLYVVQKGSIVITKSVEVSVLLIVFMELGIDVFCWVRDALLLVPVFELTGKR